MTLKTPEQITREHLDKYFGCWPPRTAGQVTALIEAAIDATLAGVRDAQAQAWREGWDASERFGYLDGVLETPLNPYLEADDDEEPTSAEERDYGKYLDQQFWGDRD